MTSAPVAHVSRGLECDGAGGGSESAALEHLLAEQFRETV
jgi:hypothetical protein